MTDPVDKFLSDAVSAARDNADEGVDDGARTRLRLRESLANHGASRRKRFTLIAAVIASLFGSTAFAYWAGWRPPWNKPEAVETPEEEAQNTVSMRLPEHGSAKRASIEPVEQAIPDAGVVEQLAPVEIPPPPPVEVAPAPIDIKPVERKMVPHRVVKPAQVEVAPAPVETAPVEAKPAPVEAKRAPVEVKPAPVEAKPAPVEPKPVPLAPRVTTDPPKVEAPKAQPSADIAAYRYAHNLHFRGNDPKAALAAWDDYLAKYPNGSLALEARYDRALVLVKLARWNEARIALAPFANASVGSYRQKEATEILAAIRDR